MTMMHETGKKSTDIRRKAEEILKGKTTYLKKLSSDDAQSLVHELQVHQIELEMQNEELRRAHSELEDLRNMYSDLYDFAPIGYFTFDKNGLILEVNLTGAKKLDVERPTLIKKRFSPYIHGNKNIFYSHLQKVFINLISNARDAIDAKGKDTKRELHITTGKVDSSVVIEFEDTGIGADEETTKRMFTPFFTTKEAGSGIGLGLPISSRIINDHKGKINVECKFGKGCKFTILLPSVTGGV